MERQELCNDLFAAAVLGFRQWARCIGLALVCVAMRALVWVLIHCISMEGPSFDPNVQIFDETKRTWRNLHFHTVSRS